MTDDLVLERKRNQWERVASLMYPSACDACVRRAIDIYEDHRADEPFAAWALTEAPWLKAARPMECGCCDHGDMAEAVTASIASDGATRYWNIDCRECGQTVDTDSQG